MAQVKNYSNIQSKSDIKILKVKNLNQKEMIFPNLL